MAERAELPGTWPSTPDWGVVEAADHGSSPLVQRDAEPLDVPNANRSERPRSHLRSAVAAGGGRAPPKALCTARWRGGSAAESGLR